MPKLPKFKPTAFERTWVANELRTAKWVRAIWSAASPRQRRDPEFIMLLARSTWVNTSGEAEEPGRRLRNRRLAEWTGLAEGADDHSLVTALCSSLSISNTQARWLVRTPSGITHYYKAFRNRFHRHLRRHVLQVFAALNLAATKPADPTKKARAIAKLVTGLPDFATASGGTTAMLNGLSPLLACLDPQRRFPIVNDRTVRLLSALGKDNDAEGIAALSRLIGQFGIRHSFDLDVYAAGERRFPKSVKAKRDISGQDRTVGLKAEESTTAQLARRRVEVRRLHNKLINRFKCSVEWRYPLLENRFDVLVADWRPGRKLLVEAKPGVQGALGRTQLRQAIGQLFDYRWTTFDHDANLVDLALLTLRKPPADVIELLASLRIEALWFEGRALKGTVVL